MHDHQRRAQTRGQHGDQLHAGNVSHQGCDPAGIFIGDQPAERLFRRECRRQRRWQPATNPRRDGFLDESAATHHALPFSAAFKAHEDRTNQRWLEARGYYAVGGRENAYANWQTGWCGGLAVTLPLLAAGAAPSRERALKNIDFAVSSAQAPSGFFHGVYDGETWFRIAALTVCAQLLGHTMFNRVVGRVGATVVSTAILLEVPMAGVIAAIFLDQTPPNTAVPAGLLLLAGVFLVVRAEGRVREEQQANLPVD